LLVICRALLLTGVVLLVLAVQGSQPSARGGRTQIDPLAATTDPWTSFAAPEVFRASMSWDSLCSVAGERRSINPEAVPVFGASVFRDSLCSIAGERRSISPETAQNPLVTQPPPPAPTPDLAPWQPDQSWPTGAQYDPRLDQTVQFWRAGIPLRDVFGGVTEQTGVEIGFHPPGDDNERICVNLYLSPENPPTLRDLMAQLSWVTDCRFAVSDESGQTVYALLATSMKDAAQERIANERRAAVEAESARNRGRIGERLEECRAAWSLSREELIAKYRGRDDLLLLTLVAPYRRGLVEYVLGMPEGDLAALLGEGEVGRGWRDCSAEQQALLEDRFGFLFEHLREHPRSSTLGKLSAQLERGERPFRVSVEGASSGSLRLIAWGELDGDPIHVETAGPVRLVDEGQLIDPNEIIEFSNDVDAGGPTDQDAVLKASEAAQRRQGRHMAKAGLEKQLSDQRPLSPDMEQKLSRVALPGAAGEAYALWAVQEAVASRTGVHVVSDCFAQPRKSVSDLTDLLYGAGGERPNIPGLTALRLWCLTTAAVDELPRLPVNDATAGWEWHDAGSFLRFRSRARDLWRAAFLPAEALRAADSWVSQYVDRAAAAGQREQTVHVNIEGLAGVSVFGGLSEFQREYGGRITYGDPIDETECRRQSLREALLGALSPRSRGSGAGPPTGKGPREEYRSPLTIAVRLNCPQRLIDSQHATEGARR
jgi:hypothetical protein